MNKNSKILVTLVAGCLLLTACGAPKQETVTLTGGGTTANQVINFPDDNGGTISLKVGDTLEIQIPTIPTAGYNWVVQDIDPTILTQVNDSVFITDAGVAGTGGTVKFTFKAIGTGTMSLTLIYANSPDTGSPAMYSDSYGVTIEVK